MIIDFDKELYHIESQPEWIGVSNKINSLKAKRKKKQEAYQKTGIERILTEIIEIDEYIMLFEAILIFWERNWSAMKNMRAMFEAKASDINKAADLHILISDLRTLLDWEYEYSTILNELLLIAYSSNMDVTKMQASLSALRTKVVDYNKFLHGKYQI